MTKPEGRGPGTGRVKVGALLPLHNSLCWISRARPLPLASSPAGKAPTHRCDPMSCSAHGSGTVAAALIEATLLRMLKPQRIESSRPSFCQTKALGTPWRALAGVPVGGKIWGGRNQRRCQSHPHRILPWQWHDAPPSPHGCRPRLFHRWRAAAEGFLKATLLCPRPLSGWGEARTGTPATRKPKLHPAERLPLTLRSCSHLAEE